MPMQITMGFSGRQVNNSMFITKSNCILHLQKNILHESYIVVKLNTDLEGHKGEKIMTKFSFLDEIFLQKMNDV